MAADLPDRKNLDPDAVAAQSFSLVRKGFEPDEVRAFQLAVASSMREAKLRFEDMERRLAEVERRAADPKDLDEHAVTQLLGEETARVLETARQAANDIRARAEAAAATREAEIDERDRTTREAADQYAAGVRTAADEADRRIRADAERYAEEVRGAADTETAAQRAAADEYDQRVRGAADTEIAELRATAEAETERLRAEAASVLTERTAEAEIAASAISAEADTYANRVRGDADRYAEATRAAADSYRADAYATADAYKADAIAEGDRIRNEALDEGQRIQRDAQEAADRRAEQSEADAAAALDAAREQGRQMVEEARTYRERVIADLAERRRTARAQLEGLAATRDALAVALSDVATQVTTSHRVLHDLPIDPSVLGDAAADRAALAASDPPPPVEVEPEGAAADADDAGPEGDTADEPGGSDEPEAPAADADAAADAGAEAPGAEELEPVAPEAVPAASEADGSDVAGAEPDEGGSDAGADANAVGEAAEQEPASPEPDTSADEPPAPPVEADADRDAAEALTEIVEVVEIAEVEAEVADDEVAEGDVTDADTDADPREGRIDELFARIRADRREPGDEHDTDDEAGDDAGSGTAGETGDGAVEEESDDEAAGDVDPDTDLLDRRDAALAEIEKALARKLKRVLADEQNETLDLLRRTKGTPVADAVLPAEADHQERYRSAVLDDLAAAERSGAGFFGPAPDRAADVFDVAGDFATEILRQIRAQLLRAFDDGGDEFELGDRIRSCYREWKTQRIADTAEHFVVVAFNRGVAEAAADGTAFRWLLDDGDQPCPDCDDNRLGGAVPKGEPFPTGDLCPPAHPGCRCLAVPV